MHKYTCYLPLVLAFSSAICAGQQKPGASIPWHTYEAEEMFTNGTVMMPKYEPYQVETESSGQRCVKLSSNHEFVEFVAAGKANGMVIRYSLPDADSGGGLSSTLSVYKNKKLLRHCALSSRYSWLYGKYPFTNNPAAGFPRNFYDEIRLKGFNIKKGDTIRIQRTDRLSDKASFSIIDLVDLENVKGPIHRPPNSLSVTGKEFVQYVSSGNYTQAFRRCVLAARDRGQTVWIPPGVYKISGDIVLPANSTIQGAGMWYTQLVGEENRYSNPSSRVRIKGGGDNIHIADFSVIGKLTYRNDQEANDGIVGSFGKNSTISGIWIEHTKVGMWIENSTNLRITGCRMRNTIADGINFCVGMARSTIENCTARGTGDDCFAFWPAVFARQQFLPGNNQIINCTAQLPFLANGAAIYGGQSNQISNCLFTDISQGSAILISTTFPTENRQEKINNNFSGTTLIQNCLIKSSGGFDHEWDWRAAIEICLDKRSIRGIQISNVRIDNSFSNALSVIAKNENGSVDSLSGCTLKNVTVSKYGMGVKNKHALFISGGALGELTLKDSNISQIENSSKNFAIVQ